MATPTKKSAQMTDDELLAAVRGWATEGDVFDEIARRYERLLKLLKLPTEPEVPYWAIDRACEIMGIDDPVPGDYRIQQVAKYVRLHEVAPDPILWFAREAALTAIGRYDADKFRVARKAIELWREYNGTPPVALSDRT